MAGAIGVRLHPAGRPRNPGLRPLARGRLGGGSDEMPPEQLDAAIIFATVGDLVPLALKAVRKGGRVVCAGIHMSDIPSFPYAAALGRASARVGRQPDATGRRRFPEQAPEMGIVTRPRAIRSKANQALADLRAGRFNGAACSCPEPRFQSRGHSSGNRYTCRILTWISILTFDNGTSRLSRVFERTSMSCLRDTIGGSSPTLRHVWAIGKELSSNAGACQCRAPAKARRPCRSWRRGCYSIPKGRSTDLITADRRRHDRRRHHDLHHPCRRRYHPCVRRRPCQPRHRPCVPAAHETASRMAATQGAHCAAQMATNRAAQMAS